MNVALFGATGMLGQGVLRECLLDPDVTSVLCIGRSPTGKSHPKLRDLTLPDLTDYASVEGELGNLDACFFCLGVSSAGMSEEAYRRITYDLTIAAAQALLKRNPGLVFVFVSGQSTDSSEKGRTMWARVKGQTENALLRMPFKAAYMFRPGFVQPMHGEVSRTKTYRILYALLKPLVPLLKLLFSGSMATTEQFGRAMLRAAKTGAPKPVLDSRDIVALGA